MSELNPNDFEQELDEEMTVTLELEDGPVVCSIITILTVDGNDYIALSPLDDEGNPEEDNIWFYGYKEDPDDPNVEPELRYIEDDDELEAVFDKFDEYCDELMFEDEQ